MERYKANEIDEISFYMIPKELFTNPRYKTLSNDARLLYALLRDRLDLSSKNAKEKGDWFNDKGEIFLYFSRDNAAEYLNVSHVTIVKAFSELRKHDLISEEKQGLGKPNKIYVGHMKPQSLENQQTFKFCTSGSVKSKPQEVQNLNANHTDFNHTDFNKRMNDLKPLPKLIQEKTEELKDMDSDIKNKTIDIITDLYTNGIKDIPIDEVRENLNNVNVSSVNRSFAKLSEAIKSRKITNPASYFKKIFYNEMTYQKVIDIADHAVKTAQQTINALNMGGFDQRDYKESDIEDLYFDPSKEVDHENSAQL